jgi:hypothetical protein
MSTNNSSSGVSPVTGTAGAGAPAFCLPEAASIPDQARSASALLPAVGSAALAAAEPPAAARVAGLAAAAGAVPAAGTAGGTVAAGGAEGAVRCLACAG